LEFISGNNKLVKAALKHGSGSLAEVYLHGAHVTSWKTTNAKGELQEQLFLSEKSIFAADKAIRGGIPIIFPQFGPGKIQSHGFARNVDWTVSKTSLTLDGAVFLQLELKDTEQTRKVWPHSFHMTLTIVLGDTLHMELNVLNTDENAFEMTNALHTYFKIGSLEHSGVGGLKGTQFIDKLKNNAIFSEDRDLVTFPEETDRVYLNVEGDVSIHDREKTITLRKTFADVVVWNPWIERAKSLADLGDEEYLNFFCVEVGNIANPVRLDPGARWFAEQTVRVPAKL